MQKEKPFLSYLYLLANRTRNQDLLNVYERATRFIKSEKMSQLEKFLRAVDYVAVHAVKMTKHQRMINRERFVNVNGHTYYLFDRRSAWTVGVVTETDIYIYR